MTPRRWVLHTRAFGWQADRFWLRGRHDRALNLRRGKGRHVSFGCISVTDLTEWWPCVSFWFDRSYRNNTKKVKTALNLGWPPGGGAKGTFKLTFQKLSRSLSLFLFIHSFILKVWPNLRKKKVVFRNKTLEITLLLKWNLCQQILCLRMMGKVMRSVSFKLFSLLEKTNLPPNFYTTRER